jgi:RNA recognition motif-containing protein
MSGWDDDEQTTKNVDVDRAQHDDDRREERRDERGASESHHTNHNETTVAHAPNAGNNIYVTNLSPKTTDESLREHFSPFGELVHCQCVKDPQTSQNRYDYVA